MNLFLRITPPLIVATGTVVAAILPSLPVFARPAQAGLVAPGDIVGKKVALKYMVSSEAVRIIKETAAPAGADQSASKLPEGIAELTPDDAYNTVAVRGTPKAIQEVEAMIRLLDVKARLVRIELRLIEIRRADDGTRKETLLQSPIISTTNNTQAMVSFQTSGEARSGTKVIVTPHLNGDDSITLRLSLARDSGSKESVAASQINTVTRLTRQGEWKTIRTLSLSTDKKIQEAMLSAKPAPAAAYPLYRLDAAATEVFY
ncbi:MAG: hypothetical protein H7145_05305 [Akkermansiaceae bacterium]|nr:hypothetical protein [Armatimonadota bacterium]